MSSFMTPGSLNWGTPICAPPPLYVPSVLPSTHEMCVQMVHCCTCSCALPVYFLHTSHTVYCTANTLYYCQYLCINTPAPSSALDCVASFLMGSGGSRQMCLPRYSRLCMRSRPDLAHCWTSRCPLLSSRRSTLW